jgi:hypothetical protein
VVRGFFAYDPGFSGGVFVARGNVDGAGRAEIVTGTGAGGAPHVRVFDAHGADTGVSFMAYDPGFTGGVRVASCDVTGSGSDDIVTAPGPGGAPHVRAFGVVGGTLVERASFFAYDPGFTGGVWVACGDVTGDGIGEIVTGTDAGGGAHVRVFSLVGGAPVEVVGFLAYDPGFLGGARVAAADVYFTAPPARAEVLTAAGPGGGPEVIVWDLSGGSPVAGQSLAAFPPGFTGGVFVAAGSVDGPGTGEIVVGAGAGGGPQVRAIDANGNEVASFFAYDPGFLGGVTVSIGP